MATLWESNCPFGFLLVMFPLGSSYFVFDVSNGRCGIIVSVPDHCLPFYFIYKKFYLTRAHIYRFSNILIIKIYEEMYRHTSSDIYNTLQEHNLLYKKKYCLIALF